MCALSLQVTNQRSSKFPPSVHVTSVPRLTNTPPVWPILGPYGQKCENQGFGQLIPTAVPQIIKELLLEQYLEVRRKTWEHCE